MIAIKSVEDYITQIKEFCPDAGLFRGQNVDWPLMPAIGRYPEGVYGYNDWRGYHDGIIRTFKRLGRPYFDSRKMKEPEIWAFAQHHGLPTRLLDWTSNPLKALFFAVDNHDYDDKVGVLWLLTFISWREDLDEEHRSYWENELVPFIPEQLTTRITTQEGCFLSYPLPETTKPLIPIDQLVDTIDDNLELVKFTINPDYKATLRFQLARLGIQYRLLFPNIEGVVKSIISEDLSS